jgi:hypothetical protein
MKRSHRMDGQCRILTALPALTLRQMPAIDLSQGTVADIQRDGGEVQRGPGILDGKGCRLVPLALTGPRSACNSNERPNKPQTIPKAMRKVAKRITSM